MGESCSSRPVLCSLFLALAGAGLGATGESGDRPSCSANRVFAISGGLGGNRVTATVPLPETFHKHCFARWALCGLARRRRLGVGNGGRIVDRSRRMGGGLDRDPQRCLDRRHRLDAGLGSGYRHSRCRRGGRGDVVSRLRPAAIDASHESLGGDCGDLVLVRLVAWPESGIFRTGRGKHRPVRRLVRPGVGTFSLTLVALRHALRVESRVGHCRCEPKWT